MCWSVPRMYACVLQGLYVCYPDYAQSKDRQTETFCRKLSCRQKMLNQWKFTIQSTFEHWFYVDTMYISCRVYSYEKHAECFTSRCNITQTWQYIKLHYAVYWSNTHTCMSVPTLQFMTFIVRAYSSLVTEVKIARRVPLLLEELPNIETTNKYICRC